MFVPIEAENSNQENTQPKKSKLRQKLEKIKAEFAKTGHILFGEPTPKERAELPGRIASLGLGPTVAAVVTAGLTSGERASTPELKKNENEQAASLLYKFYLEQHQLADFQPGQPYSEFLAQNLPGVGMSIIDGLRDQILEEGFKEYGILIPWGENPLGVWAMHVGTPYQLSDDKRGEYFWGDYYYFTKDPKDKNRIERLGDIPLSKILRKISVSSKYELDETVPDVQELFILPLSLELATTMNMGDQFSALLHSGQNSYSDEQLVNIRLYCFVGKDKNGQYHLLMKPQSEEKDS